MGILMDFYAGDADAIAAALDDPDGDEGLGDAPFVRGHADFSLNIGPDDLDPLVHRVTGGRVATLAAALVRHLAGPDDPMEATWSADLVSPVLVEALAGLPDGEMGPLASDFARAFGGDDSADLEEALRELVALCRDAKRDGMAVVFTWTL